jgi:pyridoxamine 5'-phosphate oxidase
MASDFTTSSDPFHLFDLWFSEASGSEMNDANAMTLATIDESGLPNARIVLLKGHDRDGFVFYTNTQSAKGRELAGQPRAALLFHWKSLQRQVRIRGEVTPVLPAEADAYFATRPRDSQIGAWASEQSRPLDSRATFEDRLAALRAMHDGVTIPRPPHWSGFRVVPSAMEFWQDRPFRLHDRVVFRRQDTTQDIWTSTRLYP